MLFGGSYRRHQLTSRRLLPQHLVAHLHAVVALFRREAEGYTSACVMAASASNFNPTA